MHDDKFPTNAAYIHLPQAPAVFGLSRSAIYRAAAEGQIKLVKLGRSTLVDAASARAFLANLPAAEVRRRGVEAALPPPPVEKGRQLENSTEKRVPASAHTNMPPRPPETPSEMPAKPKMPMLRTVDMRTKFGKILGKVRTDLTEYLGGEPSATQKMIIEMTAQLSLRLSILNERVEDGREISSQDHKLCLEMSAAITKNLGLLGVGRPETTP